MVYVSASITAIGNSSFKMAHRIVSGKRGVVAADVGSTLVWLDYRAGKPLALPPKVRKAFEKLEGKPLPRLTRVAESRSKLVDPISRLLDSSIPRLLNFRVTS
jgi:hypothetical protein